MNPSTEGSLTRWGGAADRGLAARQERQKIVEHVLRPSSGPEKVDGDFGIIPGTPKPTLLKPGAEKITDSLELYPYYEPIEAVQDFERPLFFYRYRCLLKQRGSDATIATGIGSCNSMEDRYRWRKAERVCPTCGKPAIIKGRAEYGGGWLCYKKKDGCGAKFKDGDAAIEGQETGRVPNPDVHSQVNTIDKMAQKRALVAAVLNLGFSEQFTQDVEDLNGAAEEHGEIPPTVKKTQPKGKPTEPISEEDRRMMWARWREKAINQGIPMGEMESRLKGILLKFGYDSGKKITNGDLDKILEAIRVFEAPNAA